MDKHAIEIMCRKAGMLPVKRGRIDGAELFIADGFSATPHITFRKFGVEAKDFPGGCYATLWWVSRKEDQLDIGQPLFFELLHNPEYGHGSKQVARINAAMKEAKAFLAKRKKMH